MNLAIDIGNTAVKWAAFEGTEMVASGHGMPAAAQMDAAAHVMATASGAADGLDGRIALLSAATPLPISVLYKSPATLGTDRLADACGAAALAGGAPCLIIDAGTCITVDYLDADRRYHGGAILPGLCMSLRALHEQTARLPLLLLSDASAQRAPLIGRTTEECILAGTLTATKLALAGFVSCYKLQAAGLRVIVSGGDAATLTAGGASDWQHVPDLTLIGLNQIMIHNQQ